MSEIAISRRRLLVLSGMAVTSAILGRTRAQGSGASSLATPMLRIGAIVPTYTGYQPRLQATTNSGGLPLDAFSPNLVGGIAGLGATMAGDDVASDAEGLGFTMKALITSAPSTEAVVRAAERLVGEEEVYAIVGGFSTADASTLSQLSEKRNFIFVNICAQSDSLRDDLSSANTFHLAGSATMYLKAMVKWFVDAGCHRWFTVYSDGDEQVANHATLRDLLRSQGADVSEVGSAKVEAGSRLFTGAFSDIRKAKPDLIVLLLGASGQLIFLGQYETSGLGVPTIGYPTPETQTRLFYDVSLRNAQRVGAGRHIATWDSTLTADGASELNSRFLGRFGQAMDPSAWAAYVGIRLLANAAMFASTNEPAQVRTYLEESTSMFDIDKGVTASFEHGSNQMYQPFYMVRTNADYLDKKTLQDLATVEAELPVPP